MRLLILLLIISIFTVTAVAKVAELWDIPLTTDQVNMINAAGAKGATITLTTAQCNLIKQACPNLQKNTMLVTPAQITSNKHISGSVNAAGTPSVTAP
jgi:hypothetical protein